MILHDKVSFDQRSLSSSTSQIRSYLFFCAPLPASYVLEMKCPGYVFRDGKARVGVDDGAANFARRSPYPTELKGSIGEGPNHSNHSNRSNSFKIGIFPRKFKNFRKFQHFLNYRRNSDKISSKSEQKSVKRIQK